MLPLLEWKAAFWKSQTFTEPPIEVHRMAGLGLQVKTASLGICNVTANSLSDTWMCGSASSNRQSGFSPFDASAKNRSMFGSS